MSEQKRSPLMPLCDLYLNERRDGSGKYLAGRLNKYTKVLVLPNRDAGEGEPTHRLLISHDEWKAKD